MSDWKVILLVGIAASCFVFLFLADGDATDEGEAIEQLRASANCATLHVVVEHTDEYFPIEVEVARTGESYNFSSAAGAPINFSGIFSFEDDTGNWTDGYGQMLNRALIEQVDADQERLVSNIVVRRADLRTC